MCDMDVQHIDAEQEWLDHEKNRIVNRLVDFCLSLTEDVRLKDLIESSTRKRRMAVA